jgi:hypothetical protein
MSSRTQWTTKPIPPKIIGHFPREMREQMQSLASGGKLEWHMTGGTHLELRQPRNGKSLVLSLTGNDPVWAAKWRSAVRKWEVS